jgi:antitoxin (DNA-binding transcriptional repressor) of toxin-antitoxin stability system
MSEAFEVSPDDAAGVAEAIRRAAAGGTVRLVRDGHPVAEIVPPARAGVDTAGPVVAASPADAPSPAADDAELDAAGLAALEARMAALPPESGHANRVHAERFGAPTLAHYRRVYAQAGAPWPGEAFVRRHYPVAEAS